jgi:hypothetical protein
MQYLPHGGLWSLQFTRNFGNWLLWATQESLPNSLHVLLSNTGTARALPFAQTPCGFEFTIPVVNGLSGWRILPKTSAKIALNSCNWLTLHVIQHTESLLLLGGRHIYSYRLLAANWWVIFYGGWYENKLSEMLFHCCMHHLSALTFFVHMTFLKVFTYFVKTLYLVVYCTVVALTVKV